LGVSASSAAISAALRSAQSAGSSPPCRAHRLGHLERRVRPLEVLAGRGDLGIAERRTVAVVAAAQVRRAEADHGPGADQARLVVDRARLVQGAGDRLGIVAIDVAHHVPAVGLEASGGIVGEPALDVAVDRDAVVVPDRDQLAEPERARQRARLVGDALHQAAVAEEGVGVVVDDLVAVTVVLRGQHLLGERHADRVADALTERAGGGLDAGGVAVLGVARGLRVPLAEGLQVVDRDVVAGQVQQRVDQHRTVAVGEHEAVAVRPIRVGRVVAQHVVPQHLGDVGHAHRRPRVSGIGLLDGIHAERADGVGEFSA
jgi:hypothetical protein